VIAEQAAHAHLLEAVETLAAEQGPQDVDRKEEVRGAATQLEPSRARPPPVTMQWE
jgi:hypothetical protein